MTETDWLNCTDPAELVILVRRLLPIVKPERSQLRLFARTLEAVALVFRPMPDFVAPDGILPPRVAGPLDLAVMHASLEAALNFVRSTRQSTSRGERLQQITILREIIGNPFRRIAAPDRWPEDVTTVARAWQAGEDCLYALHDALEESGYTDLAEHLAEPNHGTRCWARDLILGWTSILEYELVERLGSGAFGEIWKARSPEGSVWAMKFIYGDFGPLRDATEFMLLRQVERIRHPHLLTLERFDSICGRLILTMELSESDLWNRFRSCREAGLPGIPRGELLDYMTEAAEVLDEIQRQTGSQHLDIKPQNLFLVHGHIKVGDFGLVKDMAGMVSSITGGVTPVYAAPETFDGVISPFCDQYSLAIVYQELLTGQRPFTGTNIHQLVMQHVSGLPNLDPLPAEDRPVIGRALAKTPEDRWPTCTAMVRALREAA